MQSPSKSQPFVGGAASGPFPSSGQPQQYPSMQSPGGQYSQNQSAPNNFQGQSPYQSNMQQQQPPQGPGQFSQQGSPGYMGNNFVNQPNPEKGFPSQQMTPTKQPGQYMNMPPGGYPSPQNNFNPQGLPPLSPPNQPGNQPPPQNAPGNAQNSQSQSPTKAPESPSKGPPPAEAQLSTNVLTEIFGGVTYNYFLAEKQAKSGIGWNLRLFWIDQNELNYATKFDLKTLNPPLLDVTKFPKPKDKYDLMFVQPQEPTKEGLLKLKIQKNPKDPKDSFVWTLRSKNKDKPIVDLIYVALSQARKRKDRMQGGIAPPGQFNPMNNPSMGPPNNQQGFPNNQQGQPSSPLRVQPVPFDSPNRQGPGQQGFQNPNQFGPGPMNQSNMGPMNQSNFGPQGSPNSFNSQMNSSQKVGGGTFGPQGNSSQFGGQNTNMNTPTKPGTGQQGPQGQSNQFGPGPVGSTGGQSSPNQWQGQQGNQQFGGQGGQGPSNQLGGQGNQGNQQFGQGPSNQFGSGQQGSPNQYNSTPGNSGGQSSNQFYGQGQQPTNQNQSSTYQSTAGQNPSQNMMQSNMSFNGGSNSTANLPPLPGLLPMDSLKKNESNSPYREPNNMSLQNSTPYQNEPNMFQNQQNFSNMQSAMQESIVRNVGNNPPQSPTRQPQGNMYNSNLGGQNSFVRSPQDQQLQQLRQQFRQLDRITSDQQPRYDQGGMSSSIIQADRVGDSPSKMLINNVQERKRLLYGNNQNWNYQFAKGEQENTILNFQRFAQALVIDIIDDLSDGQRNYNPSRTSSRTDSTWLYTDYHGVDVRLCFTESKEYRLVREGSQLIYDESAIKAVLREFHNMNYLLQTTRNKGRLRVPLASIVEYKGIVAFVKAQVARDDSRSKQSLVRELESLARDTRIIPTIFEDERCISIAPVQTRLYEKLARDQNSPILRQSNPFDIFYLDNVRHYLPVDIEFAKKNTQNYTVRPQLLEIPEFNKRYFFGEGLAEYYDRPKVSREVQDAMRELKDISKEINKSVAVTLESWENLDEMISSSSDISHSLHRHGLNVRYLGLLFTNTKVPAVRRMCMAEIAARCAKVILRQDMQQYIKNTGVNSGSRYQGSGNMGGSSSNMLDYAIHFMNTLVDNTQESNQNWSRIKKQALYNYNVQLSTYEIAEGFFVQALMYHCRVNCDCFYEGKGEKLFIRKLFQRNQNSYLEVKSKAYNLAFTDLYRKLNVTIDNGSEEGFQQIQDLLNLKRADLPDHLKLSGMYEHVALYLAQNIPPRELGDSLPCSSIYRLVQQGRLTTPRIQIGIAEIKWCLKFNRDRDAQLKQQTLTNKIYRWLGEQHPSVNEIYMMLGQYNLHTTNYPQAIKYAQNNLSNCTSLLGANNLKTAEAHFLLGETYMRASQRNEALNSYRKAKNIFDSKKETESESYARVLFKLSTLLLQQEQHKQASELTQKAIKILENLSEDESMLVDCYELLSRIYEADHRFEQMVRLAEYCGTLLPEVKKNGNLQKMIKLAILPQLKRLGTKRSDQLSRILEEIPYQKNAKSYENGQAFIRSMIQKGQFMPKLKDHLNSFDKLANNIRSNGIVSRWRGLDGEIRNEAQEFVAMMEALTYFLGEGFMMGALKQN